MKINGEKFVYEFGKGETHKEINYGKKFKINCSNKLFKTILN